jgi:transcription termination/antitermination protein NusA
MAKEILTIVDSMSNAKAISRQKVFEALEVALATATKKKFNGLDVDIKVTIDQKSGDFTITRRWLVVDTEGVLENPARETTLVAARYDDENIQPGDYIEEMLDAEESVNSAKDKDSIFDRITAQTVKQVLQQKVKEAERQQVVDMFRDMVGKVVVAIVKRATRDTVFLDLGNNAEAVLRRCNMLPRDSFRPGDRVRSLLLPIREDNKGSQLEVSRTSADFLKELLTIEVPEIGEGQLEIVGAVRDPGSRAKVAIKAKDRRIDPRGACIGMKGSRVKNVSDELCHEKVDIIVYNDDFSKYVINAMEPAEVRKVFIDKTKNIVEIGVEKDKYALAIGTGGQNVKLASMLIGWKINVLTVEDMDNREKAEVDRISTIFSEALNIDDEFANALVDAGFGSIEEIAYVDRDELLNSVDGMDEDLVDQLQNIARKALADIYTPDKKKVSEELLALEGMDNATARALASKGISTLDDLAECVVDDLTDIPGMENEKAGKLIVAARNLTWFKDGE